MLCNLGNWGMAAEDGPRLDAHSAVREFALHPKWRAPAITLDVPFCAAPELVRAVVLERCSVLVDADWMRSMTSLRTDSRVQYRVPCSRADGLRACS
jgi:hypothetical protein